MRRGGDIRVSVFLLSAGDHGKGFEGGKGRGRKYQVIVRHQKVFPCFVSVALLYSARRVVLDGAFRGIGLRQGGRGIGRNIFVGWG